MKRHIEHYLRQAMDQAEDNNALDADRSQILLAFQRANGGWRDGTIPVELAAAFVSSVNRFARFLAYRGDLHGRIDWGKRALQVAEQTGQLSAIAQLCASTIAWPLLQIGDYEQARRYCEQGIHAAQQCKAPRWIGAAARTLSGIARDQNRADEAKSWANKAFLCARQADDTRLKRGAVLDLAYAAILDQDYVRAEKRFRLLLRLVQEENDKERVANRSMDVALVLLNQGLTEESAQLYRNALTLGHELDSQVITAEAESGLGKVEQVRGNVVHAEELALSARQRFAGVGITRQSRADQFFAPGWLRRPATR